LLSKHIRLLALLSKHIRLLAAFDHRHIFLDPSPDPAVSFAERDRLFKLPRSSAGGGIYPRTLKSIDISAPVRQALGLDANVKQLSPNELMNAILKAPVDLFWNGEAPVDLFWNGGIGTYVKAASESHTDVGDRANNGLRVNGGELRCKV
ncbi:NAD-glutamate dehydrogenase, partial [Xanthomonas vasicola]